MGMKCVIPPWINGLPVKVGLLKDETRRTDYMTVEECHRLRECAKADDNDQIYPFIVIGLETSMRRMESRSAEDDRQPTVFPRPWRRFDDDLYIASKLDQTVHQSALGNAAEPTTQHVGKLGLRHPPATARPESG
jgi:hypothetical protein